MDALPVSLAAASVLIRRLIELLTAPVPGAATRRRAFGILALSALALLGTAACAGGPDNPSFEDALDPSGDPPGWIASHEARSDLVDSPVMVGQHAVPIEGPAGATL